MNFNLEKPPPKKINRKYNFFAKKSPNVPFPLEQTVDHPSENSPHNFFGTENQYLPLVSRGPCK